MISPALATLAARNLRLCWAGEDVFERGAIATVAELEGLLVQRPSRPPAVAGRGRGRPPGEALAPIGPQVALNARRIGNLIQYLADLPAAVPAAELVVTTDEVGVGDLVSAAGYGLCRVLALTERAIGGTWIPMAALERERDGMKLTLMRSKLSKFEKAIPAGTGIYAAISASNVTAIDSPYRRAMARRHGLTTGLQPPPWGLRYLSRRHYTEDEDGQHVVLDPPRVFDGLVTYVWSDGAPWLTRFWLEPTGADVGAVDLSGLRFDIVERDLRELEEEEAERAAKAQRGAAS